MSTQIVFASRTAPFDFFFTSDEFLLPLFPVKQLKWHQFYLLELNNEICSIQIQNTWKHKVIQIEIIGALLKSRSQLSVGTQSSFPMSLCSGERSEENPCRWVSCWSGSVGLTIHTLVALSHCSVPQPLNSFLMKLV